MYSYAALTELLQSHAGSLILTQIPQEGLAAALLLLAPTICGVLCRWGLVDACDCVFCVERRNKLMLIERFVASTVLRYIIPSFYLNFHLEGGEGGDTISFRWEGISVSSQFGRSQLRSQTWDCRLRSCFKCCSSFRDTLPSPLNSVTNNFTILACFAVVKQMYFRNIQIWVIVILEMS